MNKHASLFSVTRILHVIVILLLILPGASIAAEPDHYSIRVQEGLKLVETFYTFLLSDAELKDCPDIFTSSDSEIKVGEITKKTALIAEWEFFRNNKELFLFLSLYCENEPLVDIKDIMSQGLRGYYFLNPPPGNDHITEGHLYIVISGFTRSAEGILKQMFFPIEYDDDKNSYAISPGGIKINGLPVNYNYPEVESEKNFDMFERLGFKEQRGRRD